ncbi:hypothetical protein V3C99_005685 [Haemonchus contortus]
MYSSSIGCTLYRYDANGKETIVRGKLLQEDNVIPFADGCLGQCIGISNCDLTVISSTGFCLLFKESNETTMSVFEAKYIYKLDRDMKRTDCGSIRLPIRNSDDYMMT